MPSNGYVVVRDDVGALSLPSNEREFLRACAAKGLRADGRRVEDVRKSIRLNLGRWDNGAESTVQWGVGTRVTTLCTADLVPPNPDRPNEGMVNISVDLSPMAGTSFRLAPPVSTAPGSTSSNPNSSRGPNFSDQKQRLLSNRIIRCIERLILLAGALDTEALVLVPGKWVWRLRVATTVLDDGGNILDACVLATMAALRHYRKPQVDFSGQEDGDDANPTAAPSLPTMIPSVAKEATALPLHHTPLSITFALIPADDLISNPSSTAPAVILIDPTDREELVQFGSLTIAMNVHAEVCLLDYGGGYELSLDKLKGCLKSAEVSIKQLCTLLEDTLKEADDKAQAERLERLKGHSGKKSSSNVQATKNTEMDEDTPFFDENTAGESNAEQEESLAQTEEEEAYRKEALDFTKGHVATAVREDGDRGGSKPTRPKGGTLLANMLRSASQQGHQDTKAGESSTGVAGQQPSDARAKGTKKSAVSSKNQPKPPAAAAKSMDVDSDNSGDEEAPTVLMSEFGSASK